MNVLGQGVGVGPHRLDGLIAVSLVDADRSARAHSVGMQENHDVPDRLLLGPCSFDLLATRRPDSIHLFKFDSVVVNDREDFLAEFLHQLFCVDWADAFDQAAGEVFFNPLSRFRRARLDERGSKLQPVLFVLHPVALSRNPLARVDARKRSYHSHQFPVALHLYSQHRKSCLFAVEGDALDQSRESLLGRRRWRGVHARSQLAWRQDPVISRSRHFHQTVAVRTLGEILLCALTRLKISKPARTGQFSEISVITLYSTKCSIKRMLSEPNPHCWPTSRSFRISERIYSLKLM